MRTKKIRFVYMVLVGIAISFLLDLLNLGTANHDHSRLLDFVISISITILVWEGNLRIDTLMNRWFSWEKNPMKRVLVHFPVIVIFSAALIYLSMLVFNTFVCALPPSTKDQFMLTAIITGTLISVLLLSLEIGAQFFGNWKRSLVEVEKYKAQSLQAQLQNLKDQINPHFMFNNLSVLSSLVYKDQDKAVDFISQLSKVYRYLLDSHSCELVRLDEELNFVQSYTYLLQIRFDKNLSFEFDISDDHRHLMLPPMALQILIENAIKHNEISEQLPLSIRISTQAETLEVRNNLQLRTSSESSSKNGLKNIRERYKFFTTREMEVLETGASFSVRIPLLRTK